MTGCTLRWRLPSCGSGHNRDHSAFRCHSSLLWAIRCWLGYRESTLPPRKACSDRILQVFSHMNAYSATLPNSGRKIFLLQFVASRSWFKLAKLILRAVEDTV